MYIPLQKQEIFKAIMKQVPVGVIANAEQSVKWFYTDNQLPVNIEYRKQRE